MQKIVQRFFMSIANKRSISQYRFGSGSLNFGLRAASGDHGNRSPRHKVFFFRETGPRYGPMYSNNVGEYMAIHQI